MSKVVIVYFDGLCSADMHLIEAKENTNYIWYFMLSDEFFEQTTTAGSRTVLHKINQKELLRIACVFPLLPSNKRSSASSMIFLRRNKRLRTQPKLSLRKSNS